MLWCIIKFSKKWYFLVDHHYPQRQERVDTHISTPIVCCTPILQPLEHAVRSKHMGTQNKSTCMRWHWQRIGRLWYLTPCLLAWKWWMSSYDLIWFVWWCYIALLLFWSMFVRLWVICCVAELQNALSWLLDEQWNRGTKKRKEKSKFNGQDDEHILAKKYSWWKQNIPKLTIIEHKSTEVLKINSFGRHLKPLTS